MKNIIFILGALFSVHGWSAGSVSMATGGSGRGTLEPIDSVLLNPGTVGLLPTKFMSVHYQKDEWGLVIADNGVDALFPAAILFSRQSDDLLTTQKLGLALNYRYKKLLSVGATASMVEYDPERQLAQQRERQTTVDLGVMMAPMKSVTVGLVANKVTSSKIDFPENMQTQQTVGIGAQYTFQNFLRFRFDVESGPENKTNRLVYMGGLESFINDWLLLRFGYQNNNVLSKNYTTLGAGFTGPQFGVHYGFKMNPEDRKEDLHSFDLGVPF